jgi:hypothetical protein
MNGTLLATLLQISDLHVGDLDPRADNHLNADAVAWWMRFRPFDGYLGHTRIALRWLQALLVELYDRDGRDNVHVVVTGDLTTTGSPGQMQNTLDYLFARLSPTGLGLRLPAQKVTAIPGNHDHWPGNRCRPLTAFTCMLGGPTSAIGAVFPDLPTVPRMLPLGNGRTLRIDGVNTEHDVDPRGWQRVFAIGSCISQSRDLAKKMPAKGRDEIRVLLAHHPPKSLGPGSKTTLASVLTTKGVRVLLTGHTHAVDRGSLQGVQEVRCGTTTSRDYFEPQWGIPRYVWRKLLKRNTALVHRLLDRNGAIHWETEIRRRLDEGGPFEPDGKFDLGAVWP